MAVRFFTFRTLLRAAALAVLLFAYDTPGFWYGAVAMFLLWWADNEKRSAEAKDRERRIALLNAPELAGKDDAAAMAHVLRAIDDFNEHAPAEVRDQFAQALQEHQVRWQQQGTPMPPWATLRLLRSIEASGQPSRR